MAINMQIEEHNDPELEKLKELYADKGFVVTSINNLLKYQLSLTNIYHFFNLDEVVIGHIIQNIRYY